MAELESNNLAALKKPQIAKKVTMAVDGPEGSLFGLGSVPKAYSIHRSLNKGGHVGASNRRRASNGPSTLYGYNRCVEGAKKQGMSHPVLYCQQKMKDGKV